MIFILPEKRIFKQKLAITFIFSMKNAQPMHWVIVRLFNTEIYTLR